MALGQTRRLAGGAGATVHALQAKHVGMTKGRPFAPDHPLIHRSPPIRDTGRDRLVLVIDAPMARDGIPPGHDRSAARGAAPWR